MPFFKIEDMELSIMFMQVLENTSDGLGFFQQNSPG